MGFDGFLSRAGVELINVQRTEAYLRHQMPAFPLKRIAQCNTLNVALEDEPYESPLIDDAPWVNASDPATHGFFGMYPIEISGIGDSTLEAGVTESLLAGGTVGEERDATRKIRVRGLLVGVDELAVEAGLTWLRAAVRTDDCSMHGLSCGASDLRYFLACPDVCIPLWSGTEPVEFESLLVGVVTPSSSPVILNNPFDLTMPGRVAFNFEPVDGVVIEYGRMSLTDATVLERFGPLTLRRTNYLRNPSFTLGVNDWEIGDDADLVRVATGGVDGGAFGRAVEEVPVDVRTNWFSDPAFTLDPASSGWRSNGAISRDAGAGAVGGTSAGLFDASGPTWAEVTAPGPSPATTDGIPAVVSMYVEALTAASHDFTITITDNLGVERDSQTTTLATGEDRLDFATTLSKNWVVRVETDEGFRVSGLLLETGVTLDDYFDGSFADDPGSDLEYLFLNGTVLSPSRRIEGERIEFTLTATAPETPYGELTTSFWLSSLTSPTVTARLISGDDATVLAETVIAPGAEWVRYQLATDFGRNVILEFTSNGDFHIDQAMIEVGPSLNDYLDGDMPLPAGYEGGWLGIPNGSLSRITWLGDAAPDGGTLHAHLYQPDSQWRPFISALQGELPDVTISWGLTPQISLATQLEPYERNYHRVGVTMAPKILRRYKLSRGAAIAVEMTFVAGTPYAYSNEKLIPSDDLQTAIISDTLDVVTNLAANASGESATTGYVAINGTSGTAAITNPVSTTAFGTRVLRSTWSVASTAAGGGMYCDIPVTAGETYSFSVGHVKSSINNRIRLTLEWRTAIAQISSTQKVVHTVVAGTVYDDYVAANETAPDTATVARLRIESVAGTGYANWSIGSYLEVDGVQCTRGISLYPFIYGALTDTDDYDYAFTGTAHLSSSTRTVVVEDEEALLIDPDCAPTVAPPEVPTIDEDCIDDIIDWRRYWVPIPAEDVALWAVTVPTVTITSKDNAQRQVRVRFYPNPFEYEATAVDDASYCGEFVLSYIPPNTAVTVNGMTEEAWASVAGRAPVAADHLLYGSDGGPMTWPELSCALPYYLTIDVPIADSIDDIDVELVVNRRE